MMRAKRYTLHLGFWALYFSITYFNELFLTSGRDEAVTIEVALKSLVSEGGLMLLKAGYAYFVLYYFLPAWLKSSSRSFETFKVAATTLVFVFLYRLIVQAVTWPLIINFQPELSFASMAARYFYSLLEILQILGITVTIKLLRLRLASSRQEKELLHEKMSSELIRLRSQIHPHFLFNMLNSAYAFSRNNSPLSSEVILKMSDLLRFMLYESDKKLVTLADELKVINDYIQLQQLRFGDKIRIEKHIAADNYQAPLVPLLIFPLIENAFKHGLGARADNSYIYLKVQLNNNTLEVETQNAVLEHSVKNDKSGGIGLANIKKQLSILYPDNYFWHGKKENVYHTHLRINLNSYVDFELFNS